MVFLRKIRSGADRPLEIPSPDGGSGEVVLEGRRWRVSWGPRPVGEVHGAFPHGELRFPLTVRGRAAGDRIRFPYGSKKLKKVFLEARVPARRRAGRPVVVDADGEVLWIPGIARSALARGSGSDALLHIGFTDVDED